MSNQNDQNIIAQSEQWVKSVIVAHNYCPFAKREVDKGSVRYQVIHETEINILLKSIIQECVWLDQNSETETTLLIFPSSLNQFDIFLDTLAITEDLLNAQGYEGVYQIASFHPDYCFQGAAEDDAANYTNRSPYPMFHLIREASMQKALENHPDPESIPERNIEFSRQQGLEKMKGLLKQCTSLDKDND